MNYGPFLVAGFWTAIGAVIVGLITYRQAVRVAAIQAQAQLGVRQSENGSTVQNLWHDDLKEARKELVDVRADLTTEIKARANAEAKNVTLQERNDELDAIIVSLRSEIGTLNRAAQQCENDLRYHNHLKTNPTELRRLADEIDRRTPTA